MKRNKKLFLRVSALVLVVAFSFLEAAQAAAFEPQPQTAVKSTLGSLIANPQGFQAPLDFATLKEVRSGDAGRLILHIQDPHSNLSGQENLAKSLDEILAKYPIRTIFVEGGVGDVSFTEIRKALDKTVCSRESKRLLIDGQISGEEYLNLTTEHAIRLVGIEDASLYHRSVRDYAKLASMREGILNYLAQIKDRVQKLKKKLYPADLQSYEELKKKSDATGDSGSAPAVEALTKLAGLREVDFTDLAELRRMESLKAKEVKVDYNAANMEQALLLQEIAGRSSKQDLEALLSRAQHSRSTIASQYSFFVNTFNIASEKHIDLKHYPNLEEYFAYLREFSSIDLAAVIEQSEILEDRVYAKLLINQDSRLLRAIDRYLALLETAYRIRMSSQEFALFTANEKDFLTVSTLAFLNRKLAENGYAGDWVPYQDFLESGKGALTDFYASVDARDQAFLAHADVSMKESGEKAAVLITGGYHTAHLKELFEKHGFSYIIFSPNVSGQTDQKKYEKMLLNFLKDENEAKTKDLAGVARDTVRRPAGLSSGAGSYLAALVSPAPRAVLEEKIAAARLALSDTQRGEASQTSQSSVIGGISVRTSPETAPGISQTASPARSWTTSSVAPDEILSEQIRKYIDLHGGGITFSDYMNLSMYASGNGFYSSGVVQFSGAPNLVERGIAFQTDSQDPLFGYGLARQIAELWKEMGSPDNFQIIEQGGGEGTLARNILDAIADKHPELYHHVRYTIVDISPALSERQKRTLSGRLDKVDFKVGSAYQSLPFNDQSVEGVFISNELPDAFPVHWVVMREEGLREVQVTYQNGAFVTLEIPVTDERIFDYFRLVGQDLPVGKEFAVNLAMDSWMQQMSRSLKRGFIITVDYGFEKTQDRYNSTHQQAVWTLGEHTSVLTPGIDITHNVDFRTLAKMGERAGLKTEDLSAFDRWAGIFAFGTRSLNKETFVLVQSKGMGARLSSAASVAEPAFMVDEILKQSVTDFFSNGFGGRVLRFLSWKAKTLSTASVGRRFLFWTKAARQKESETVKAQQRFLRGEYSANIQNTISLTPNPSLGETAQSIRTLIFPRSIALRLMGAKVRAEVLALQRRAQATRSENPSEVSDLMNRLNKGESEIQGALARNEITASVAQFAFDQVAQIREAFKKISSEAEATPQVEVTPSQPTVTTTAKTQAPATTDFRQAKQRRAYLVSLIDRNKNAVFSNTEELREALQAVMGIPYSVSMFRG